MNKIKSDIFSDEHLAEIILTWKNLCGYCVNEKIADYNICMLVYIQTCDSTQ